LRATIADTGRGFAPEAVIDGVGLSNMTDRIAVINGTLSIDGSPGLGTRLTIDIANPAPAPR
jgi:signal transduction histidine kinase